MLDASKTFDHRVCFSTLFNILLDSHISPIVIRFQQWCQGAVIYPLLFTIYIDALFTHLEHSGVGCHISPVHTGSVGYAD